MSTNTENEMVRNLKFFKKQAAQHLLTPKSQFDFVKESLVAKTGNRKTLKVKNNI